MRKALEEALINGIPSATLREVILTSYLFDGFPTALEGFRILEEAVGDQSLPTTDFSYTHSNIELWRRRGETLCRQVYGPQYHTLISRINTFAPELQDAMIVEGYGKVLSRDELDAKIRELIVVAMLAVKNRPRQLLSHCLGALRLGVTKKTLHSAITAINDYTDSHVFQSALLVFENAVEIFRK